MVNHLKLKISHPVNIGGKKPIIIAFISMFHVDLNLITKKKMKITELVGDFQTNINEYLAKQGYEAHIEFKNRD